MLYSHKLVFLHYYHSQVKDAIKEAEDEEKAPLKDIFTDV